MLVSQLSVKLFLAAGAASDDAALIPIFHRWIREQQQHLRGKLLIDVADYRHVKDGPGVVLIGHQAHWGVGGLGGGGHGLIYARKRDEAGELPGKLVEAFGDAIAVAAMLEAEPSFGGRFDAARARVLFMGRLHAANDAAGLAAARPELEAFASTLWGSGVSLSHAAADPRAPLTVDLASAAGASSTLAGLADRLR